MRTLFFKIFLWFWLATVLVVGVLALTTLRRHQPPSQEHRLALADNLVSVYGRRAIDTLGGQGLAALRQDIEEIGRTAGLRVYVFGATERELLDQPVPAEATELVAKVRTSGRTELPPSPESVPLVAKPIAAANGLRYIVAVQFPPGPLSQLFASPYVLALRLMAVVAMAGILCYGLARYLTAPLRRLRASTRQLAGGDLAVRVGPAVGHRRDEIGELGRDFDYMAERIESLVSSQRRLLQDMSHELRSPLTRLNVAVELAAQRAGPEAGEALDRIEREAQRLNELIGQLLVLARLEADQRPFRQASVDLSALVQQVATDADFEARSLDKQVTLTRCDRCLLAGDSELLRRAIENVVRNAIRYTAEKTAVEMSLFCEQSESPTNALIRIRDHGPGVPEDSIHDIFRPFHRIGDSRDRQSGGVGLGLAIAQQAIQSHGGSITAANASGGGLLVEINLPAETAS